ncbi:MAG TPA: hypothetical protein ENN17_11875 [bacterium]|nr:hypothetical protein [bacterium]
MKTSPVSLRALLIPVVLAGLTCHVDPGLEPVRSAIEGVITFTGDWPAPPAEVRIVSARKFPPSDISEVDIGEVIPADVSTHAYTYYLDPGTYPFIGVAWREKDSVWDLSSVCGVYFTGTDSLVPGRVVIGSRTEKVRDVNLSVDRSRARRNTHSRIAGTIDFVGAWPDSFSSAIVIALTRDPLTQSISLLDLNLSAPIPRDTDRTDYRIAAPAGTYRAVGVLFLKANGNLSIGDLYYSLNVGGLVVDIWEVPENQTAEGPDFTIQIGPVLSGISGIVSFAGEWPAPAEEVRLIAATTFPPAFEELTIGERIPGDASTHDYMFSLRLGVYKLIGVAWRAEQTGWDVLSICGVHFAGTDSLAPGEIEIPSDTSVIRNVDIRVNRSKAHKVTDTKIAGSITFNGMWPADIMEARVIATTRFSLMPTVLPSLLDLAFGDRIVRGTERTDYLVQAFPGKFAATGVIFFKEGQQTLSLADILYSAQIGALSLEAYEVMEDSTGRGPDFNVRF